MGSNLTKGKKRNYMVFSYIWGVDQWFFQIFSWNFLCNFIVLIFCCMTHEDPQTVSEEKKK